ncbi:Palmitoyltransferase zdhhc13 [Didymella heteroderae]|uniref:Palmitoyltransferase AKR1 n=1 Tax=Didymella heteroderae TaxID=1769908 RepID=A0A9P4WWB3_9PLEO|nr:Palmitoyltransferase zdhhc13 [Didymella heteroderae]
MASGDSSGQHELDDMADKKPSLPVEEDIMQLARLGEIGAIQKLFDSGKFDATYTDEQGITPLHWAAINNHYALCHFLIQSGAPLNAKGGDAVATPVLWAAKRCNYYIVNLLLEHGADPLLTDDQGFNLLHSATLDGNVYQLVLLLHQDIPVDIPDPQSHTPLMWAAYKGYPSCVDLFLRWGANVYATDDQGFTALHWALVKGSQGSIQKLLEYGADRFAKNNDGKTPAVTAEEMNTTRQWRRALSEAGYKPDGSPKEFPIPGVKDTRWFLSRFIFFWPFAILLLGLWLVSYYPVFVGVPLALISSYVMQMAAQKLLQWGPSNMRNIHHSPFLAGIFAGTLFWVGVRYVTTVLPGTIRDSFFTNIVFAGCYGLTAYFYFFTMSSDPGYVPKSASRSASKAIIDELMELRHFDEHHFCVNCMVRKPLRSKHCKRCERCVAKSDHHCPWVNNCVANNNHRHFVLYVLFMELGILAWLRLAWTYLDHLPKPKEDDCNVLSDDLCEILNKDPSTIVLSIWAAFQLTWVTMLLCVQLLQIARNLTTYESMRGHLNSHTTADAVTSFVTTGDTSQDVAGNAAGPGPPGSAPTNGFGSGQDTGDAPKRPQPKHSVWDQWKRLLAFSSRGYAQVAQEYSPDPARTHGPIAEYDARVDSGRLRDDEHQRNIIKNLQDLHDMLADYTQPPVQQPTIESLQPPKKSFFSFLSSSEPSSTLPPIPASLPKGMYMYGDVGSGKTMMMDLFYDTLPPNITRKTRIHFHAFMQSVHKDLHKMKMQHGNDIDSIPYVAANIAERSSVLCFDEFQCTDVADAMILRRLMEALMAHGTVIVTTSNRHPDDLYKNGIQRESFIPCINLLKRRLTVLNLDSQTDYRKIPRPPSGVYHHPLDASARTHADRWFRFLGDFEHDPPHRATHQVWGRDIVVPKASGKCAWFSFDEIIGRATGAADYLELSKEYEAFVVTDVPGMNHKSRDLARRFITFIDALYESRSKLVLTTAVPLTQLFLSADEVSDALQSSKDKGQIPPSSDPGENLDDAMRSLMDDLGMNMTMLKNSSIFSGDEERFAFARALSRLSEMGSQEWVERGLGLEKLGGKQERDTWQKVRSHWKEDHM